MDNPRSVSNYFALESWINDNIPVAGETFREFVKSLYQSNLLVKGEFWLGGRRVDLGRITCPLLLLTAKNDHLVAPASTEGIRPHVGTRDIPSMEIGAGHVGLVVSGKAHQTFWPAATRWLGERSTSLRRATSSATRAPRSITHGDSDFGHRRLRAEQDGDQPRAREAHRHLARLDHRQDGHPRAAAGGRRTRRPATWAVRRRCAA